MENKTNDSEHFDSCHKRWIKRCNHSLEISSPDSWFSNQCGFCAYFLILPGEFRRDWGVCSNEKSPLDGKVAFEHDGCDFFVEDEAHA
jgi:hypothetical protein